jgi:hypothetical protein
MVGAASPPVGRFPVFAKISQSIAIDPESAWRRVPFDLEKAEKFFRQSVFGTPIR